MPTPLLPQILIPFRESAEKLIQHGAIQEIEFSRATFQVHLVEKGHDEWVFLQLTPRGELKDFFCTCSETSGQQGCAHIAASWLALFNKDNEPLHLRFLSSFWFQLFFEIADDITDPLKLEESNEFKFENEQSVCKIELIPQNATAKEKLSCLFCEKKKETEENSLKFSNLTEEELSEWRLGHPTPLLQYELSPWSDLAKWLFRLQDAKHPYTLSFSYDEEGFPIGVIASFDEIKVEALLGKEKFLALVPSLSTVLSPLKVFREEELLDATLSYDKKNHSLSLHYKDKPLFHPAGISFGEWDFVKGVGFFAKEGKDLFSKGIIHESEVAEFLSLHTAFAAKKLDTYAIQDIGTTLHYSLSFDPSWNLIISAYLSEPDDLSSQDSHLFGDWVFKDPKGFFRISSKAFPDLKTLIEASDINDFIRKHRSWLGSQKGFGTHVSDLENELTFQVDEGSLSFQNILTQDVSQSIHDFGEWIYVEGEGFFAKHPSSLKRAVFAGLKLLKHQIAPFIRNQKDELSLIPHFFSDHSPIKEVGFYLHLNDSGSLEVGPKIILKEDISMSDLQFFDEYVFAKNMGFFKLLLDPRLPTDYLSVQTISKSRLQHFFDEEYPKIAPFALEMDPRLEILPSSKLLLKKLKSSRANYLAEFEVVTTKGNLSLKNVYDAFHKKERWLITSYGVLDLKSTEFDWLRTLDDSKWANNDEDLMLTGWELIRLSIKTPPILPKFDSKENEKTHHFWKELTQDEFLPFPPLEGFKATLRPYQQRGVEWLSSLYQKKLSGILADDMGLGKTLQAMALIAAHAQKGHESKFLVVCPTSVLYHWQDKLKEFLPNLKVFCYWGSHRELDSFKPSYDLLLTSYGVARIDRAKLKKIHFDIAVFDEIQLAKNYQSRLHSSLKMLRAKMLLGLTGTPIENSIRELKALFDLVLPHYLPGEEEFREQFLRPIERDDNEERKKLLKKLVRPFILRRKKDEVLKELPEKTEELAHCPLAEDQYRQYVDVLNKQRSAILEKIKDNGEAPPPYLHIFSLLLQLKQICDHPACYLKTPQDFAKYKCGKWNLFLELLEEARESGQKVVVFSQFLNMLDIMQHYFEEKKIGFATIRGSTKDRAAQLSKFKTDPQCEVFLGSLQASGLGIDLTAASVVIHYDRWWNAARENQATDRVHRIGQTRGVQVFKLVTKGSFEERIEEMIQKKSRLMDEMIETETEDALKRFSIEELVQLLQDPERPQEGPQDE